MHVLRETAVRNSNRRDQNWARETFSLEKYCSKHKMQKRKRKRKGKGKKKKLGNEEASSLSLSP